MARAGIPYLSLTLTAAVGVLGATLAMYIAWGEGVPQTFPAAVVNAAATPAAAALVGFSICFSPSGRCGGTKRISGNGARKCRKSAPRPPPGLERLLEEARVERERAQAQQEQNRQMIADLTARNLELNARLIDILERRNGNGSAQSS